jgi:release factor glutamine methyltransferase
VKNLELWEFQITQLIEGNPIQYIIGQADFWGMKFMVSPAVLIPRPETEELVQIVSKSSSKLAINAVLDIGTGSGCIALSLKKELPNALVCGLDVSPAAIKVAKQNSQILNLNVEWICCGIEEFETAQKFDTIISNPPYIPISDKKEMAKHVLDHEPHLALFAPENDPLYFYKIIGDFAKKHLTKSSGRLYFEAHHIYAKQVFEYFAETENAELVNDMFGKPRFIVIAFNE